MDTKNEDNAPEATETEEVEQCCTLDVTVEDGTVLTTDLLRMTVGERIQFDKYIQIPDGDTFEQKVSRPFWILFETEEGKNPEMDRFVYWLAHKRNNRKLPCAYHEIDFVRGDQPGDVNIASTEPTLSFLSAQAKRVEQADPTQPDSD